MKLKNISFVDKHIHKIILAAAALFAVGVVLLYVVGDPYRVELQKGKELKPSEVETEVMRVADDLKRRIDRRDNPLPEMPVPDYTEDFQRRAFRSPVGKSKFEVPLGPPGLNPTQFPPDPPPPTDFLVQTPPPPAEYRLRAGYDVLALPEDARQAQALIRLVGDQQPRDFSYVTVGATFDMDAWRQRLRSAPADERIPEDWWRGMMSLTHVILERQMLDPITGRWGSVEVIPSVPGSLSFHETSNLTPIEASNTVQKIRQEQERIARPPFPATSGEQLWVPPGSDTSHLTAAEQARLKTLSDEIAKLGARIDQLRDAGASATLMENGSAPPARQPGATSTQPVPQPPPGQLPGGTDMHMPPPPPDWNPQGDTPESTRAREAAMAASNVTRPAPRPSTGAPAPGAGSAELTRLIDQRNLKVTEYNNLIVRGSTPAAARGAPSRTPAPIVEPAAASKVRIWAHDLTVKPGATYRYRISVGVLNPLFQRKELSPDQKREYFQRLSLDSNVEREAELRGTTTEAFWSTPIAIDRETYFFLTAANASHQNVTVEIWRIFGGKWVSKEVIVQAGDAIGRPEKLVSGNVQRDVDLGVGAIAVDINFNASGRDALSRTTTRLLYLDVESGRMLTRTVEADRDDPMRTRLRNPTTLAGTN